MLFKLILSDFKYAKPAKSIWDFPDGPPCLNIGLDIIGQDLGLNIIDTIRHACESVFHFSFVSMIDAPWTHQVNFELACSASTRIC